MPSITRPPPMPVPTVTYSRLPRPLPAPMAYSASAAAFTSVSMPVGTPNASLSVVISGYWIHSFFGVLVMLP